MMVDLAARGRRALLVIGLVSVLVAALSCSVEERSADVTSTTTTPVGDSIADLESAPPGTLLRSAPFPTADMRIGRAGADATRITYRSTSGLDGTATAVTGVVFAPRTKPPSDGWPVVAYAHPGVGILNECAPSRYSHLLGNGAHIEALLDQGYLVVMTDYQGLGSKGPHPFLEPVTLAHNVIDSVRAARQLVPGAGKRWAAYGLSEGGEAAWAAAELAPAYGQGLEMVGAAALAPTVNMSAMPQAALERKLTFEQLPVWQYIVNSASWVHPEIAVDDYLRGPAIVNNRALLECEGEKIELRNRLYTQIAADDITPSSPEAAAKLTDLLRAWSLPGPRAPTLVPVLVLVGSLDETVLPDWTRDAARLACERGSQISWILRVENHNNLKIKQSLTWLADRFGGLPVEGACVIT